jgi:hypothetical protein
MFGYPFQLFECGFRDLFFAFPSNVVTSDNYSYFATEQLFVEDHFSSFFPLCIPASLKKQPSRIVKSGLALVYVQIDLES